MRIRDCLAAALRLGLYHAAARTAVFVCLAVLLGPVGLLVAAIPVVISLFIAPFLSIPGLTVWAASAPIHALIARKTREQLVLMKELGREMKFDATKSTVVILSRLPLLLLAFVSLHLFVQMGLWVGDNLCGFDLALPIVVLSLSNRAYDTTLVLACWLLLAPYFEASNFLLHIDARTRQEGLDLLFRVQRSFPLPGRKTAGAWVVLVLGLFTTTAPVRAVETALDAVKAVRRDVETIAKEVKESDPYPGGARWEDRLHELARRLEQSGNARGFQWFTSALEGFRERSQAAAFTVLNGVQRRLSLLEETLALSRQAPPGPETGERQPVPTEDIKRRVRPRGGDLDGDEDNEKKNVEKNKDNAERREVRRDDPDQGEDQGGAGGRKGSGIIAPAAPGAGLSVIAWWVLAGLLLAIFVASGVLFFTNRRKTAPAKQRVQMEALDEETRPLLPHEQPASVWLREADDLARRGQHLEALRAVYLAVLSQLHREQLIRFETTRTNGEYVQQVRLALQASPELHEPFENLTNLFEVKWYGDRTCDPDEYSASRDLAREIEGLVPAN